MFDFSKIFDFSKKFALPDTFFKSKNYCTYKYNLLNSTDLKACFFNAVRKGGLVHFLEKVLDDMSRCER